MKVYKISTVTQDIEEFPNREWTKVKEVKSLSIAKKQAITISKKSDIFEAEIIGLDEYDELIHHSYWRNGKLEINMNA